MFLQLRRRLLSLCLGLLAAAWTAPAAGLMYSIGGNDFGQPVRVVGINPDTASTWTLFDLAGDNAAFSGLTFNPNDNLFYAVMDDGSGISTLVNFSPSGGGAFQSVMPLVDNALATPLDFNGGLVFNPNDGYFYSMANVFTGASILFRVDVAGGTVTRLTESLPLSFTGGLTTNADGTLAGMRNDSNAESSVYQFTLHSTLATAAPVFPVGAAFFGGLSWDGGTIYALSSAPDGGSYLNSIDGSGNPTALFGVGNGFLNAGLTTGPAEAPEPGTIGITFGGLALCGVSLGLRRTRRA